MTESKKIQDIIRVPALGAEAVVRAHSRNRERRPHRVESPDGSVGSHHMTVQVCLYVSFAGVVCKVPKADRSPSRRSALGFRFGVLTSP